MVTITQQNIADIHFIQDKASALNCQDFEDWVKDNCTYREVDSNFIEFDYGSITATMDRDSGKLTCGYECYDEHRNFMQVIYCDVVEFN